MATEPANTENSKESQPNDAEPEASTNENEEENKGANAQAKETEVAEKTEKSDETKSLAKDGGKADSTPTEKTSDIENKIEGDEDTKITTEDVVEGQVKVPKVEDVKKFKPKSEEGPDFWEPKTRLGRLVKDGEITTMRDALATGLRIREPEIVDILLPDLDDEVLDVNMVQRMTDSGRRVRFAIMTVVGNQNGFVGLGSAKGKEVGPAIRKAIDNAKLNIIEIRRGCGSWECGCGDPHTIPFTVNGKSGSTKATFRPAPRGVGLAVGDVAKHILRLSGIKDAWGFTRGQTRTTINYAKAVFQALQNTAKIKTTKSQINNLNIYSGAIDIEPIPTDASENIDTDNVEDNTKAKE
jgi:small subunit ribosomal protein S5